MRRVSQWAAVSVKAGRPEAAVIRCSGAENQGEEMRQGELDGVIKARLAFFAAERALVKASAAYEKARMEYERACSQVGLAPHYAPGSPGGS